MPPADAPEHRPAPDFLGAMHGVRRLKASDRLPPEVAIPAQPRLRPPELDAAAMQVELMSNHLPLDNVESSDTLLYRGDGVADSVWRKLRRGQFRLQDELDLHGFNRRDAQLQVLRFLAHCQERDYRYLRIIHGKGNRSANAGPVIKPYLDSWLRQRPEVLAFCSARKQDGGTGAVYLLLRARP